MPDIIPRCSAVYPTGMYGAMGGRGLTPLYPISFAGTEVRNLTKALLDEYIMDFVSVKMITDRTDIKPHHNVGGMGSMFNEYIFIDKGNCSVVSRIMS